MSFRITSPAQLQLSTTILNISCNSFAIDTHVAGGTPSYSYLWSTGAQTEDISGVPAGEYTVTVTDANSCTLSKQIKVDSTATFACSITSVSQPPACLSSNNMIFTNVTGATYQWKLSSSDSSWAIQLGAANDTLIYKAGNPNSSATFSLTITKDGCSQTCSYSIASCSSAPNSGGNNESCNDCFSSTIVKNSDNETCATYTVAISTDGNCKYDLSHFVIAVPECAEISGYSDDANWPLVLGKDPTTGLTGLKVDNVNNFGSQPRSFNLTFKLCWSSECSDQIKNWNPVVAYKAGQCIAYDTLHNSSSSVSFMVYPNPSRDSFCFDITPEHDDEVTIEMYDQQGIKVCEISSRIYTSDKNTIKVNASNLRQNLYTYRLRTSTRTYTGRILKLD
jgi:hypothetical protein